METRTSLPETPPAAITAHDTVPARRGARLPFLDWTRGLAVLLMIPTHVFNCFMREDLRDGSAYVFSQFVGGMAAPLFLFLAGITLAFQMESQDRKQPSAVRRVLAALRRAGYILALAFAFRISNWLFSLPKASWHDVLKVDILNCMGAGMAAFSLVAICSGTARARVAALVALAIAAVAPLVTEAGLSWMPWPLRSYLVPNRLAFPLIPWAAYLGFGISAGTMLRLLAPERIERTMQWSVMAGLGLIVTGQYFSNLPYSLYTKSDFWTDSPALVLIRLGLMLCALAGAFLWTEFIAGPGWSWVQTLGKTSLMVYWVHVVIVYGRVLEPWRARLSIAQTSAVTVAITALMLALAMARLHWKPRLRRG